MVELINNNFEAYKIKREITRSGINYELKRDVLNKANEPTGVTEKVGELKGLYHEQSASVRIVTGDTTQVRTKKIPMILCLYDDVALLKLKVKDFVTINGKRFNVTGVTNIQEWSIISDISLEVIDNGLQAEL